MPLQPGRRLGLFEVISPLGAGGMGEVYRARDTRLGRDVALKVLPAEFATRPDRRARFEREARLLASLQHPGIAAIHGFEGADGVSFLVLELVEGRTLAQRVDRGPLPVPEALEIASQVALALEAAHEKGIIHRDLKPSNVMLMADGRVKLLDFGLAKAMQEEAPAGSELETASDPASRTGLVVGTGPYMSPEQARGEAVDKRTDIWAFGCVLFEMLAGRRAFPGATTSDAVAAVLSRDPDWVALPGSAPEGIGSLLQRCMRKDRARRLHDIADVRVELDDAMASPPAAPVERASQGRSWRLGAIVVAIVSAVGLAIWLRPGVPAASRAPMRFVIPPETTAPLSSTSYVPFAIAPTGTDLIYDGGEGLRLRSLTQGASKRIGEARGYDPFLSPDGQWVAYWSNGRLMKAPLSGGSAPHDLCPAGDLVGGAWGPSGEIVFAGSDHGPLLAVSDRGGEPRPLTALAPREIAHLWPEFLPGGRQLLFTARTGAGRDDFQVVLEDLDSRSRALTIPGGSRARYAPSGHLIYARRDALYAVRFDSERLRTEGQSAKVLEDVATGPGGYAQYALGPDGTLYYLRRRSSPRRTLVWVSRTGQTQPLRASPRHYSTPRLSPDERQIAFEIGSWPDNHLWIYDVTTDSIRRLTEQNATAPVWASDGRRLAFAQSADGNPAVQSVDLFWQRADGSEPAELLLNESPGLWPIAWSKDGAWLTFFRHQREATQESSRAGRVHTGTRAVEAIPTGPANRTLPPITLGARLSPDQRWLASISDESGRFELYVQPFGRQGPRHQLTSEGAVEIAWSPDGRDIFYRSGDRMMAIPVETSPTLRAGDPTLLFRGDYVSEGNDPTIPSYDVSRAGRFLMIVPGPEDRQPAVIHVVLGWSGTLEARLADETAAVQP